MAENDGGGKPPHPGELVFTIRLLPDGNFQVSHPPDLRIALFMLEVTKAQILDNIRKPRSPLAL